VPKEKWEGGGDRKVKKKTYLKPEGERPREKSPRPDNRIPST